MIVRLLQIWLFLALQLVCQLAAAGEEKGTTYIIAGPGAKACAHMTHAQTSEAMEKYLAWAQGYLTARNEAMAGIDSQFQDGLVDGIEAAGHGGILVWLNEYCLSNPLVSYKEAVEELFFEFAVQAVRRPNRAADQAQRLIDAAGGAGGSLPRPPSAAAFLDERRPGFHPISPGD